MKLMKISSTLIATSLLASVSIAGEFNYDFNDNVHGPFAWGTIEGYETCGTGLKQSPIDLTNAKKTKLSELKFSYNPATLDVVNNGHTIQVNVDNGSTLTIGAETFRLLQFHFHTPSEHAKNGYRFPMEAHFVHVNSDGVLAVVGVFMKEGRHNSTIQAIWDAAPHTEGEVHVDASINQTRLLGSDDEDEEYFAYDGSLTTPPCSEGVRWHVLDDTIEVSHEQIEFFEEIIHGGNARHLQELNGRTIYKADD